MKKFFIVICTVLTFGLVLAGCSTVSNVTNSSTEIIYNGNASVMVNGYLYYGNSYTSVSDYSDTDDYNTAKATAYLSRLNTNNERNAKGKDFTPNGTETVLSEVIASDYQFMFAIGDYIYYLKPDIHKYYDSDDETSSYQFTYAVLCSVKLNGDKVREIYTFEDELTEVETLEYDGNYYLVAYTSDSLISIKFSNGKGSVTTLAEDVTSVAIPETYQSSVTGASSEWNGKIYYTTDEDDGSFVKYVTVNDAESVYKVCTNNNSISFLGRQNDVIVYTYTSGSNTKTYYTDLTTVTKSDDIVKGTTSNLLTQTSSVSSIMIMCYGETAYQTLLYTDANSNLCYLSTSGRGKYTIVDADGATVDGTIMFINDRAGYIITSTAIYEVDFSELTRATGETVSLTVTKTVIEMDSIHTDGELYSFDGTYIYYYAQLQDLTDEEQELIDAEKVAAGIEVDTDDEDDDDDESTITDDDDGYYLYRVKITNNINTASNYELLSYTSFDERHSSYVYTA